MEVLLLSFATAFTLTYMIIPSIIRIAHQKNLYDVPGSRSSHTERTPYLGGIGIFAGSIFSFIFWTPFAQFGNLQYLLCAFIMLFLIGVADDLSPLPAWKRLPVQVLAASILIWKSDIALSGLHGVLGIDSPLPAWLSSVLSMIVILFLVNAFNFIDGINGLAGSMGVLIHGALGCWFFMSGRYEFATVAFATAGAITAFLRYNFTPAKIFMGDSGALLIGMVTAILVIEFIELNALLPAGHPIRLEHGPAVAFGIVLFPVFDTSRVLITRIIRGQHPLRADRRHIHHLLIDYGLSHLQATGVLLFAAMCTIVLVFSLHDRLPLHVLLCILLAISGSATFWLHKSVMKKKPKNQATQAISL